MASLDYRYIAKLVVSAQQGSSDALAELFAATCQKQYRFAYRYLPEEYLAQEALQDTYIQAFKDLPSLKDPRLFLSRLSQLEYMICYRMLRKQQDAQYIPDEEIISIEGNDYTVRRIMTLPFTEAQVVLMHYSDHMTDREIADLLDISRGTVKRHLISGRKRLRAILHQ